MFRFFSGVNNYDGMFGHKRWYNLQWIIKSQFESPLSFFTIYDNGQHWFDLSSIMINYERKINHKNEPFPQETSNK